MIMCLIKPDAYEHRNEIVDVMKNSGLEVIQRIPYMPSKPFIEKLYDDVHPLILDATMRHLLCGPSEIVLIKESEATLSVILTIVGTETNPAFCTPDTIRFTYGSHLPETMEGGLKYYRNAIHRPKNRDEAARDMKILRDFSLL